MKTRFLPPGPAPTTTTRSVLAWTDLLRQTTTRADQVGDRRAAGLRRAMVEGKAEAVLRRMSILSETDLDREMPLQS